MALLVVAALISPSAALAHPLGNFTVNRYSRLEPAERELRVRYVADLAEIPTAQERPRLDDLERYAAAKAAELAPGLVAEVDGRRVPLTVVRSQAALEPGQAGLPTLRLTLDLRGELPLADRARRIDFRDDTFPGRVGWREVVVRAGPGARLVASSVPTEDVSDELRRYPDDLLSAPLDVREARVTFEPGPSVPALQPGGSSARTARLGGAAGELRLPVIGRIASLDELVDSGAGGGAAMAVALLLAALWGAAHALTPGHGKTIVAAYLVGTRGTARHALALGLTVTATHTWGVFGLGFLTLSAGHLLDAERVYPWLSLASGLLVVAMGLALLRSRLRGARGHDHAPSHDHEHDHQHPHDHSHEHDHHHHHGPFGHAHSHVPPDGAVGWRGLLVLGVSGGLLPCPSALLLMLGAIALGQVALGLLLVVAFSLGLAGVLTAVGLLLVHARGVFERLGSRGRRPLPGLTWAARAVPVGSALVVTTAGLLIAAAALPSVMGG